MKIKGKHNFENRPEHNGTQLIVDSDVAGNAAVSSNTTHTGDTANPHSVTKAQVGLTNVSDLKQNLAASVAPTATDDTAAGYAVGSTWHDTTNDKAYVCLDATATSAVWKETTQQNTDTTDHTALTNIGTNTHAQVDTHLADTANPHGTDIENLGAGTIAELSDALTDAILIDTGDSRLSDARTPTAHNHAAADINSGTLADARVAASNVTQHEGAIDHDALTNYAVSEHRTINDAGSATTDLWSGSKISSELSAAISNLDFKEGVETVADADVTLSGEQTINGVLTSASRVGVVGQTTASENGIYVSAAGAWTRSTDADVDAEVNQGMTFFVVNASSTKEGNQYILTTADPITVGTTALSFTEVKRIELGTTSGTAAAGDDSRIPTQDENDALVGTDGTPSTTNKFVTNTDARLSDARTPTAHTTTHKHGGSDEVATATPAANAIPKADGTGKLADGWIPDAIARDSELHSHSNQAQLDLVTDGDHDVRTDNPHSVTKTQVSLGNVADLKVNLAASAAPTATDDSAAGYSVGSRWLDTTNDKEYVCVDATATSAVWSETTVEIATHLADTGNPHSVTKTQVSLGNVEDLKVNLSATAAPGTGDDSGSGYAVGSRWIDTTNDKEYVCVDSTTSAAVWIETTASGGGTGNNDIVLGWATDGAAYLEKAGTSAWSDVASFIFAGTTDLGTPTAIKLAVSGTYGGGEGAKWRILDRPNSDALIATSADQSATTETILDLGTLSNLPATESVFVVQFQETDGAGTPSAHPAKTRLHSAIVKF